MSDLISRQTAIDDIRTLKPDGLLVDAKWIEMWLKQLPSAQPATSCSEIPNSSDDTISRQAAIYAIVNTPSKVGYHDNSEVARYGATFRQHEILDIIERLSSIQPEQHWIPCSEKPDYDFQNVLVKWHDKRKGCENDYYLFEGYVVRGIWCGMFEGG